MNNNFEVRYAEEIRADATSGMVYGKAIAFNKESTLLGGQFREIIKPSAATEEFLSKQTIVMKFNHLPDSVLAKYSPNSQKNSLRWSVDSEGVYFEFRAKKGDQYIIDSINAGDLSNCSFSFKISPESGSQTFEKRSDQTYLRTVTKIEKIRDFSLVISPAYEDTFVNTRGLDEFKQQEEIEKLKKDAEDINAEKRKADAGAPVAETIESVPEEVIAIDYSKYEQAITKYKHNNE